MEKITPSLHLLLVFLFICPAFLFGQQTKTEYLPHMLVIKYQDQQHMQTLRQKQGSDPKDKIRKFLNIFGASQPRPILNESISIKRKSRAIGTFDEAADAQLRRIHIVRFVADVDPAWLAAKVSRLPGIEYAEPKYLRYAQQFDPNDPETNPYEDFHRFKEAWEVTKSSTDVVIAIIDSGVDYNHAELDDKLWVNEDEIADNGIDDDFNGKIDDVIGWDFWDSGTSSEDIQEDNDPMMDANNHGTHVAGIAAAETDNEIGIPGTGFNARYMAVKAGGTPQNPEAIGFGFEGIMYAANNGADVINCSWGGGSFSEAENDVIEFAISQGAVVVGAAGNEGNDKVIFPAAYKNVVAVGAVETNNERAGYSNYGFELDVLATGTEILSTIENNQLALSSGTSMSTPVVSGLAALLRSLHPDWSARRLGTQIRVSASPVGNSNKLGRGKVDAFQAVDTNLPGVRVSEVAFVNNNGEKLGFDEPGRIELTLTNYGAVTSTLELNAQSISGSGIDLPDPVIQVGSISTDDTARISIPVRITPSYDLEEPPTFRLDLEDSNNQYTDFDIVRYNELLFDTMAENRVKMSVGSNGTIGFTDPLDQQGGVGFIPREKIPNKYLDGENLLFEGGFMLEANGNLFDAVRTSDGQVSRDFIPRSTFRLIEPGNQADLEGTTHFVTDSVDNRALDINLTSFAYEDPALSNVVLMLYEINNSTSFFKAKNLYAGLFNDWDIGASAGNNGISYSQQDSILYLFDEDPESTQSMVAVATLGPLSSAFAIDNAAEGGGNNFGIYDGFTDEEKKRSLKAGTEKTDASGTDVSAVVASGPYTLDPNASVKIGFVYAFGADLDELRSQIQQARSQKPFQISPKGNILSNENPEATNIFQNYPNPFNNSTRLRLDLSRESHVNISVYNLLGRKVAEIVDEQLEAQRYIFNFNADQLSSGIYFARLRTDSQTKTIKMVLVK